MYHQPPPGPSDSYVQSLSQAGSSFGYLAAKREEDARMEQERTFSRSRSRDGHRRHKHSKKKHHRRYSRSRSRERGSSGSGVGKNMHINPSFSQGSSMGPSATALLERNNILEAEVRHVRGQNVELNNRLTAMTNELRTSQAIRARYEREFNDLAAEKKRLYNSVVESKKTIATLDSTAKNAREEWVKATKERAALSEKLHMMELDHTTSKEQVEFLTKRNATLGKKCEEMVERNRQLQSEVEAAKSLVDAANQEKESMQAKVDVKMTEFQRSQQELASMKEKEQMWKIEKIELEKRLNSKDVLMREERKVAERQRTADRELIDRLEKRLKGTDPYYEEQLGIESIFRALDVVKREFAQQMQHLDSKVNPLIGRAKAIEEQMKQPAQKAQRQQPQQGVYMDNGATTRTEIRRCTMFTTAPNSLRAGSAPPAPISFFRQLDADFGFNQKVANSKSDFPLRSVAHDGPPQKKARTDGAEGSKNGEVAAVQTASSTGKTIDEEVNELFEAEEVLLRSEAASPVDPTISGEGDILGQVELVEVDQFDESDLLGE